MGIKNDLRNLLLRRLEFLDQVLSRIVDLVKIVPSIQRHKENIELSLKLLDELPEEITEEQAPKWMSLETETNNLLYQHITIPPQVTRFTFRAIENTSGSANPYIIDTSNLMKNQYGLNENPQDWTYKVTSIMDDYSSRIAKQEYLPERLDKINNELGKKFVVANESYSKCTNRIITVDQSAHHLRDVLQQVWGGLVSKAKDKDASIRNKRFEMSKTIHRKIVASILSNDFFPMAKLIDLLDNLSSLYSDLSETDFGKNPLSDDRSRLKNYYVKWLSILDGITGLVL